MCVVISRVDVTIHFDSLMRCGTAKPPKFIISQNISPPRILINRNVGHQNLQFLYKIAPGNRTETDGILNIGSVYVFHLSCKPIAKNGL